MPGVNRCHIGFGNYVNIYTKANRGDLMKRLLAILMVVLMLVGCSAPVTTTTPLATAVATKATTMPLSTPATKPAETVAATKPMHRVIRGEDKILSEKTDELEKFYREHDLNLEFVGQYTDDETSEINFKYKSVDVSFKINPDSKLWAINATQPFNVKTDLKQIMLTSLFLPEFGFNKPSRDEFVKDLRNGSAKYEDVQCFYVEDLSFSIYKFD